MEPGEAIGEWTVEARLGRGGVAEVYRCRRGSEVAAVKRLRPSPGYDADQARRRLEREAEILRSLQHPSIVKVYEVCLDAEVPWIAMELIPGRSCSWAIKTGAAAPRTLVRVADQLLTAMAHWHANGVVHRDIKPANVLLSPPGRVVVVDFGLALDPSLDRLSAQGVRLGTLAYMPPEWVTGAGHSSAESWDVYGAGQVLYELARGERVHRPGASIGALIQAKLVQERLDPGPRVSGPLRELIRTLTEAHPSRRPADGAEAHALFRRCAPTG